MEDVDHIRSLSGLGDWLSEVEINWLCNSVGSLCVMVGASDQTFISCLASILKQPERRLIFINSSADMDFQELETISKRLEFHITVLNISEIEAVESCFDNGVIDCLFFCDNQNYDVRLTNLLLWLPKMKSDGFFCGQVHPEKLILKKAALDLGLKVVSHSGARLVAIQVNSVICERPLFKLLRHSRIQGFHSNKKLGRLQRELGELQGELGELQGARVQAEEEIGELQVRVNELRGERAQAESQLQIAHSHSEEMQKRTDLIQSQLCESQSQLHKSQLRLACLESTRLKLLQKNKKLRRKGGNIRKKNQKRYQKLRQRLGRVLQDKENCNREIEAMKSSKFWKLRSFWHRIKP